MRYMNKLKYGNMAPISLSLSTKAGRGRVSLLQALQNLEAVLRSRLSHPKPIPSKANEDVLKSRRMNDELFGQLQEVRGMAAGCALTADLWATTDVPTATNVEPHLSSESI